jgi:hypothetical protein
MYSKTIILYDWYLSPLDILKLRARFFVIPGMTVVTQYSYAEQAVILNLKHSIFDTDDTIHVNNNEAIDKINSIYSKLIDA